MKSGIFWKWNLGVSLIALPWVVSCLGENATPRVTESTQAVTESTTNRPPEEKKAEEPAGTNDISTAPVQLVSSEKPLPANIRPTSPVAEIIKLANSGVEEAVMLAFVTNSTSTFNLSAEQIIYLKDIGVPDPVVTAMILRDQDLRTQYANSSAVATPWMQPETPAAPPPAEVAPQVESSAAPYPAEPAPPPTEVAEDSSFYDGLAPYGNWVNVAGYGNCWQPNVVVLNPGWQPYYNSGRWVWTDCGWYWLSDYSWGWAPFHYGRWFRHHQLGWCWAPDHVWGPSWVSWRYTDNYCGWAPLPPGACFTAGVGLTWHGHYVNHGEDCGLQAQHYRFVSWDHFRDRDLHHNHLAAAHNDRLFHESTVATRITGDNQHVVNDGLSPERVAKATHAPVRTTLLRDSVPAHGSGRSERLDANGKILSVYRPTLPGSAPSAPRWGSAPSAPSAPSALSAPSQGYTETQTRSQVITGRSASTVARPQTPAASVPLVTSPKQAGQNQPLILRGAQSSATRETVPASSLVVIGRRNPGTPTYTGARPPTPTGVTSGANISSEPLAWNNRATPWVQNASPTQPNPAAANQPTYVPRNNSYNNFERPVPTYRPAPAYQAPAYQAPPRSAPSVSPQFNPAPANSAPRSAPPAPAAAAPARSAPSAPAQPSRGQR